MIICSDKELKKRHLLVEFLYAGTFRARSIDRIPE